MDDKGEELDWEVDDLVIEDKEKDKIKQSEKQRSLYKKNVTVKNKGGNGRWKRRVGRE